MFKPPKEGYYPSRNSKSNQEKCLYNTTWRCAWIDESLLPSCKSLLDIRVRCPINPARGACLAWAGTVGCNQISTNKIYNLANSSKKEEICSLRKGFTCIYHGLTNASKNHYLIYITLTRLRSAETVGSLSAWRILPTKEQSWKIWSIIVLFLLSKQEYIILSAWWCKALLNGYLHKFYKN